MNREKEAINAKLKGYKVVDWEVYEATGRNTNLIYALLILLYLAIGVLVGIVIGQQLLHDQVLGWIVANYDKVCAASAAVMG